MTVGLVIVSHSADLAGGVAQLAGQMAPDVAIEAAGGGEDGSLGTDFDKISAALGRAESGAGVVVLYDLGSAVLTTETALEFLDPDDAARIIVVDAPLVEGALAAAVSAQAGDGRDAVAAAATAAGSKATAPAADAPPADALPEVDNAPAITAQVVLVNPLGLHARTAAQLNAEAARWDANIMLGREADELVAVRNVLAVVAMALRGGETITLAATGSQAAQAIRSITKIIEGGFGERASGETSPEAEPSVQKFQDGILHAAAAVPGLAIGAALRLEDLEPNFPSDAVDQTDAVDQNGPDAEKQRLTEAIAAAIKKLDSGSPFDRAHAGMISDPTLLDAALAVIQCGAERAWWQAVSEISQSFADNSDETVSARAVDIREAGAAVLHELGITLNRIPADLTDKIVLAMDLGPSEIPQLVKAGAVGVVLAASSTTAHAVIIARGLGLPMVIRAGKATDIVAAGQILIIDGDAGTVNLSPTGAEQSDARLQIAHRRDQIQQLKEQANERVRLSNGITITVSANIGSVQDAVAAVENGADGVGLLRTELLVLDRRNFPDEQTQYQDLLEIFEVLGDREIVVRVLDAGGDKPVRALELDPITNGFLGVRGLRWLLANPAVLHTQLRAICRAAHHRRIHLMAPMVTVAAEVVAFREAVQRAVQSLKADGLTFGEPEAIGVMIEVPAAALAADEICAVADFVSIGSNDLTSYTMAADRTIAGVADLLDPGSLAITRLIKQICDYAAATNTPVAVCGEMAGVVEHARRLVGLGVSELSMAPSRIPQIKHHLIVDGPTPVSTLKA